MNEKKMIKIKDMVDDLTGKLIKEISDKTETLTIVGSYAFDKISESCPDINLFLCLKENANAETYLKISNVLTEIINKYSDDFIVRPDFRPFKFPYPFYKGDYEVFVNLIVVSMKDKKGDFPFGLPKHFLNGIKQARKVLYGSDVLGDTNFDFDKNYLLMAGKLYLNIFKFQLLRAPLSYDMSKDFDLAFNESLKNGKMIAYLGVEIVLTEEEIRNGEYMKYIANKESMVDFYKERYGKAASQFVVFLLQARDNYGAWKKNKRKAKDTFKMAYGLCDIVHDKLIEQLIHFIK